MRATFGFSFVGFAVAGGVIGFSDTKALPVFGGIAALLVLVLALFHSLTVAVTREEVRLHFGIGLIRKRFALSDIESVSTVSNHWYNGWGIRAIRNGWLYNVSGFDAVELRFHSGRVARIGTDEPARLARAIESAAGL
jgi:hypothetical protein